MKRSLKTKTNKTRYPKGFINYKEQRNPVENRKQKKEQFDNLNIFNDPKTFWATSQPYFFSKHFPDE